MKILAMILEALRAIATVLPILIEGGKADKAIVVLNLLADLGERGSVAVEEVREDLEQLVADLKAMDGVSAEDREALMQRIEDRSQRIQDSVADLRDPVPPDPSE